MWRYVPAAPAVCLALHARWRPCLFNAWGRARESVSLLVLIFFFRLSLSLSLSPSAMLFLTVWLACATSACKGIKLSLRRLRRLCFPSCAPPVCLPELQSHGYVDPLFSEVCDFSSLCPNDRAQTQHPSGLKHGLLWSKGGEIRACTLKPPCLCSPPAVKGWSSLLFNDSLVLIPSAPICR